MEYFERLKFVSDKNKTSGALFNFLEFYYYTLREKHNYLKTLTISSKVDDANEDNMGGIKFDPNSEERKKILNKIDDDLKKGKEFKIDKYPLFSKHYFTNLYSIMDEIMSEKTVKSEVFSSGIIDSNLLDSTDFSSLNVNSPSFNLNTISSQQIKSNKEILSLLSDEEKKEKSIKIEFKEDNNSPNNSTKEKKYTKNKYKYYCIYISNHFKKYSNQLDLNLKSMYNYKVVVWRYSLFRSSVQKNEHCRVCDGEFPVEEFIIHKLFCKDRWMYLKLLIEVNQDFKFVINDLNTYREYMYLDENIKKNGIFSMISKAGEKMQNLLISQKNQVSRKSLF